MASKTTVTVSVRVARGLVPVIDEHAREAGCDRGSWLRGAIAMRLADEDDRKRKGAVHAAAS